MPTTINSTKEHMNNNDIGNKKDINTVLSNYDIEKLTNIDDIRECLRLLDDEETHIDQTLDLMLSQESELQTALGTLDILRPQLGNLTLESSKMIETINNTAKLAANISDKVRQLDKEQARTRQAISYVDDVQELKHCVSGIQEAMQRKEYDEAANLLQRSSRINTSILQGSLAEFTVPTSENPDHPAKTLADAKCTLFEIFSQRFDDAVAQRNEADITRYFKLFPMIGCQTEGLDKYSRFVCNIIKARCSEELKLEIGSPLYFSDTLTRLFENIAVIIDQHQPLVEAHYGKGKMLRVIQRLQEESDLQSGFIIDKFLQARKIDTKLNEIQSLNIAMMRSANTSTYRSNNSGFASPNLGSASLAAIDSSGSTNNDIHSNNPLVDPRQLDANLLEICFISQRASLFQGFLYDRANEEMEKLKQILDDHKENENNDSNSNNNIKSSLIISEKDSRFYDKNGLLISSGLSKRIKELSNSFLVIDEYLLKQSIDKAMKLDDYDPTTSQTSTCVDDVFYILKKVLKRSISTYHPDIVVATAKAITKVTDNRYSQVFQHQMTTAFSTNDSSRHDRTLEQSKISYMVILNNLDVSSEYTQRLIDDMKLDINSAQWQNDENDKSIVKKAVEDLQTLSKGFQRTLQSGMSQLLSQMLKSRIRPIFQESYREVKYVLDEDEYNEADLDELFVKRFRLGFDHLINLYRKTLTNNNFSTLLGLLVDALTAQWERIVMQTRFNQYGSLRFDKDLRLVIQYLSSMTEFFSRDKFTRLNQIATLLNFEEPSEIYHCWGAKAGPVSWRLTVTEVKKVLSLRLDFDVDEVTNLSL